MASAFSTETGRVPAEIAAVEEKKMKGSEKEPIDSEALESNVAWGIDREVDTLMEMLSEDLRPDFDQKRADRGEDQYNYSFENETFTSPDGPVKCSFLFEPAGTEKSGITEVTFKGNGAVGRFRIERNKIKNCSARFGPNHKDNYPPPQGDKVDDLKQKAAAAKMIWEKAKPFISQKIQSESQDLDVAA